MAEKDPRCSIGIFLNRACSVETFLANRDKFMYRECRLLEARSGVSRVHNVCNAHKRYYLEDFTRSQKSCCDPLKRHKEAVRHPSLRVVTDDFYRKCHKTFKNLAPGHKLCRRCIDDVKKKCLQSSAQQGQNREAESTDKSESTSSSDPQSVVQSGDSSDSEGLKTVSQEVAVQMLNEKLKVLSITPITVKSVRKNVAQVTFTTEAKVQKKIGEILKNTTGESVGETESDGAFAGVNFAAAGQEMLHQLRDKLNRTDKYSEKVTILSVLPQSWSVPVTMRAFNVTEHLVRQSKALVKEKGILSSPNDKLGKQVPTSTVKTVTDFYTSPDISREMPGKKDYVSVKTNETRVREQKRLVLGTLREVYVVFLERHPNVKIGFSTFANLRPKQCVFAGAPGTHSVCVCSVHQNFKLMFDGGIPRKSLPDMQSYRDYLNVVMCGEPTQDCYFGTCRKCPGTEPLRACLEEAYNRESVDEVTFKQWLSVDQCSLETIQKSSDDFICDFVEAIPKVLKHDFISKKQSEFFREAKANLRPFELLIVADFSENYAFVLQNSVQGVHWNNAQASIHPFAGYYRPAWDGDLVPVNYVVVSDCLLHDSVAVHAFQRRFISFVKEKFPTIRRLLYFSDGSAAQYKNRFNIANVICHEVDFGVEAEWHFFASYHGKNISDGLAGTLKREASRASLILPIDQQIQTPHDLYLWADKHLPKVNVCFVSEDEVTKERKLLKKRSDSAQKIPAIRSYHGVIPKKPPGCFDLKQFSSSPHGLSLLHDVVEASETTSLRSIVTRSTRRRQPQINEN